MFKHMLFEKYACMLRSVLLLILSLKPAMRYRSLRQLDHLLTGGFALAFLICNLTGPVAQAQNQPRITSVEPQPLVGSTSAKWLTIHGRGFAEGFTIRLRATGVDALIDDRSRLEFNSSEQVRVKATFGTEAARWGVQVIGPSGDSIRSDTYAFEVVAPEPRIEIMGPVDMTEEASSFTLTVYSNTITDDSVILWNDEALPTKPVKTSSNPNALTIGLQATIPAEAVSNEGRNAVRVRTPPPGGGRSQPLTLFTNPRPFYQRTWFYVLFGVALVLAGYGAHRWRLKNLRARELKEQVEVRTRDLQAEKERTEQQAARLRELDEAKSRFFANLSHEFRTPLTMILGPLDDLLKGGRGSVDQEARQQLSTAQSNAQRLRQLIDQLLDLSRQENGSLQLQSRRGDLVDFARNRTHAFAALAERRRLKLTFDASVNRLEADFDAEKLRKVVDNLLSNALKFTPEGGQVVVTVEEAGRKALVHVRDTGPGISEEELPHIFDRFHQTGDANMSKTQGGVGLGLALAKDFANLHGGDIHVESMSGEGSTFTLALPLPDEGRETKTEKGSKNGRDEANDTGVHMSDSMDERPVITPDVPPVPSEDSEEGPPEYEERDAEVPTVLIAEDHPDMQRYLRDHLTEDYNVALATNGTEALEKAREQRPDLVLSDVMMPEMDGEKLCENIKNDDTLSDVPVILLTAKAGEAARVEGLQAEADDYVEKPFSMEELRLRIRNMIRSRQALRERYSETVRLEPTGLEIEPEEREFFERARVAVEEHLNDPSFGVKDFAESMLTSKATLNRKCKAATGLTPAKLVQRLRMEHAGRLLSDAGTTVREVAYAVGYHDVEHFSKLFREYYDDKPSEHTED